MSYASAYCYESHAPHILLGWLSIRDDQAARTHSRQKLVWKKVVERMRRDFEDDDRDAIAPTVHLEQDLPRSIYDIPDEYWGFRSYNRDFHPCACTESDSHHAKFVQGTDPNGFIVARRAHVLVDPTPENGLTKQTAFKLEPRKFRAKKIGLMHFDRRRGRLSEEDHIRITTELAYLFCDEEPSE